MFRRRPLMRAAVVGGAAYVVGKKVQESRRHVRSKMRRSPRCRNSGPPKPATQGPASTEDKMGQLRQLKELLDTGVLTQAEFDLEKQKILQSM